MIGAQRVSLIVAVYVKVASQDVKAPVPIVSHHLQHNIKEDELDKGGL